ncbi:hypothetical protein OGA59_004505 [Salmonella enterica]|nr:hypothetical protein [Salmonella enterica]EJY3320380.1 hypothetical protein [Salmonella enterica]
MEIIVTVSVTGTNRLVVNKSRKEVENVSDTFSVNTKEELRTRLQAFVNSFGVKAPLKEKIKIDDAFAAMIERAVNDNSEKLSVGVRDNLYFYRVFER